MRNAILANDLKAVTSHSIRVHKSLIFDRFLESVSLGHLCLYLVNISMTSVCVLGYSPSRPPPLITGLIWALGGQNDQIDGSPISRRGFLRWVSTECCPIFTIGKGYNYLGCKPLKFTISKTLPCY